MRRLWTIAGLGLALSGCAPGYIKASELEAKGQGPSACNESCADLGMRMTALVLVGDAVPGCVCQLVTKRDMEPPPAAPPAAESGAAASTTGYVVVAAAAAAARRQQQQQQQQQQKR